MTTALSIRLDQWLLDRLCRRADSSPGTNPSGLAQWLVDEGLRMGEHPGVVFKDGPGGRRAALAFGPDVWEVVKVLRELDERGEAAVGAAAELLALSPAKVRVAMHYYAGYQAEIDAEFVTADRVSIEAEQAWQVQRRSLA